MLVYRIASPKFIEDLSGTGAKLYGGRWNDKGTAMVYFADSRAMAVMGVLVHLRPAVVDQDFILATFEIPDKEILTLAVSDLPSNWKDESALTILKQIGNRFVADNNYLVMRIPSVILEEEYNLIFNPVHPKAEQVKLVAKRNFRFDKRFKY